MTGPVRVRRLTAADAPALQELLEAAPGYTLRVRGRLPRDNDRYRTLTALPPGLTMRLSSAAVTGILTALPRGLAPGAKHVLGLWGRGCLLAVADLLRGWPRPRTAYVGLLLVREDRACQGGGDGMTLRTLWGGPRVPGVGRRLHRELLDLARS